MKKYTYRLFEDCFHIAYLSKLRQHAGGIFILPPRSGILSWKLWQWRWTSEAYSHFNVGGGESAFIASQSLQKHFKVVSNTYDGLCIEKVGVSDSAPNSLVHALSGLGRLLFDLVRAT